MIRHTGGEAWGATSTRSRSSSWAIANASGRGFIPSCRPSGSTSRTSRARILSLILGSLTDGAFVIGHHSSRKADVCLLTTDTRPQGMRCPCLRQRRPGAHGKRQSGGQVEARLDASLASPSCVPHRLAAVSSLWTPSGEHKVPRRGDDTAPDDPPGGPPPTGGDAEAYERDHPSPEEES